MTTFSRGVCATSAHRDQARACSMSCHRASGDEAKRRHGMEPCG
jgi:hypothetical protein